MGIANAKTSKIKDSSKGTSNEDKQTVFGKMLTKEEEKLAFRQKVFATSKDDRISETPNPANPYVEWQPADSRGNGFCKLRDEYKCKKPRKQRKNMIEEEIQKQKEEDEEKEKKGKEKYNEVKRILDENNINGIEYKNGVPDFSPVAKVTMEISYDDVQVRGLKGNDARTEIQKQASKRYAQYLNEHPEEAEALGFHTDGSISQKDIKEYMSKNDLTWHELNDCKHIQLVPTVINDTFGHCGGVSEVNNGALEEGGFAYKENLKKAEGITGNKGKKSNDKTKNKAKYPPGKG